MEITEKVSFRYKIWIQGGNIFTTSPLVTMLSYCTLGDLIVVPLDVIKINFE